MKVKNKNKDPVSLTVVATSNEGVAFKEKAISISVEVSAS